MGLATIDPHGQKKHTEIPKITKFGVNQASFQLTKKCMAMVIHFFVNFEIFKWLYLTESKLA